MPGGSPSPADRLVGIVDHPEFEAVRSKQRGKEDVPGAPRILKSRQHRRCALRDLDDHLLACDGAK